jgi:hypothetical protein
MVPTMNSVSLLIFWLLPLFPAGEHDRSLHLGNPPRSDFLVTAAQVRRPFDLDFPDDRALTPPAATEGDGEESCEGFLSDTAHVLFPLWGFPVENDLSFLTHSEHDHLRPPSLTLPLLC